MIPKRVAKKAIKHRIVRFKMLTKKIDYDPTAKRGSLEKLPDEILENIFKYLPLSSALRLCYISKDLYWHAIKRIYGSLVIMDLAHFQFWKSLMYKFEDLTLLKEENLGLLSNTLSANTILASFVRSIASHGVDRYRISSLLLLTKSLEELHLDSAHKSTETLKSLQIATCFLGCQRQWTSNLRELKIMESQPEGNKLLYENLARDLIKQGCHESIKVLVFAAKSKKGYELKNTILRDPGYSNCDWVSFFRTLAQKKVKLELTHMGLQANMLFHHNGFEWLRHSVKLGKLIALEISHNIHHNSEHHEGSWSVSLLDKITKYTTSLHSLSVLYSRTANMGEVISLCNVLSDHIPNQLKELSVSFGTSDDFFRKSLSDIIFRHQSNLVKFEILYHHFFWHEITSGQDPLHGLEYKLRMDIQRALGRRKLTPRIYEGNLSRPNYSIEGAFKIWNYKNAFGMLLENDPIYANCDEYLPSLTLYFTGGFLVDTVSKGLIVNDTIIKFGDEEWLFHGAGEN